MIRLNNARKYLILTEQSLQVAMAYRVRFFTAMITGLIQVLALYYIWRVVYSNQDDLNGYSWRAMVTYIFISYAVRNLYSFDTERQISDNIRDGSVTMELIKPLDYQLARLFESFGNLIFEGILVGAIVLVVGVGLFNIQGPSSFFNGLLFTLSLVFSVLINFSLSYTVGLLSFSTTSIFGFINAKRFISNFLSGGLMPLAFFPNWLHTIAYLLPFQAIVDAPISIYLGQIELPQMGKILLGQLFWAITLWIMGYLMWNWASRKITIHGG